MNARIDYGTAPLDGLPAAVTICEVGPRDGLQNEATVVPVEVKVEFVERLVDAGPHASSRRRASCTRSGCRSSPTPRSSSTGSDPRPGVRYPVLVPNERGLDRALALGRHRHRDLRQRHRDVRPAQPQPHRRRVAADVRARGRRGPRGRAWRCAATCRCASATRGRATCRSRRSSRWRRRLMALGCTELSIGDTIGVGHARAGRRAARRADRRRASRSTGSPCTSTTPTARRWPTRWRRCAAA